MGWAIGYDHKHNRDIGYGVPAKCDHPGCNTEINRGLGYVCGNHPYGGEYGCGLFFCSQHTATEERGGEALQLCARCVAGEDEFEPSPDVQQWVNWKLTHESWAQWRKENPEATELLATLSTSNQKEGE